MAMPLMFCVKGAVMKVLEDLVKDKTIKHYKLVNVDMYDNEDSILNSRNTQRLYLTFTNNVTIVIDTFCSGSAENTILIVRKGDNNAN